MASIRGEAEPTGSAVERDEDSGDRSSTTKARGRHRGETWDEVSGRVTGRSGGPYIHG